MLNRNRNANLVNAEDLKDISDRIEKRFNSLETSIETQVGKVSDAQTELKLALQIAIGEITPLKVSVSEKVSIEAHNALERRVTTIEGAPSSVRNWMQVGIAVMGCAIPALLSVTTIILGVVYFVLTHK